MHDIESAAAAAPIPPATHEAPSIRRLGSLSELTLGLGDNTADGIGGDNGDQSILP